MEQATATPIAFRVLKSSASRQKVLCGLPGVSRKLEKEDVIISMHVVDKLGPNTARLVLKPSSIDVAGSMLAVFGSFDEWEPESFLGADFIRWTETYQTAFTFADVEQSEAEHQAIALLVGANAWPGSEPVAVRVDDDCMPGLIELERRGHAVSCATDGDAVARWLFSPSSVHLLQLAAVCDSPQRAVAPRENVAIKDMTVYELILALEDDGWVYAPLPRSAAQRRELV